MTILFAFITLLIFIIWAISKYIQPILEPSNNTDLLLLVAAFAGTATVFSLLWNALQINRFFIEKRDKKRLQVEFQNGPFDKGTIDRSTKYYLEPNCSNLDPSREVELRYALTDVKQPLFSLIDKFIDNEDNGKYLLILADSGTGKTSCILNYYSHNQRRSKKERSDLVLVPLGYANAELLIDRIENKEKKVIFLDALDEDSKAIDNHIERIEALMDKCNEYKRVVITCRTQFFPSDEEIPKNTGIVVIKPRSAGEKRFYEFRKIYLSPFDDNDINNYLRRRYHFWQNKQRKKARMYVEQIPHLSVRPMLLAHIPELVERDVVINYSHELYSEMIDSWLERESYWAEKEILKKASENLAIDIYKKWQVRNSEKVTSNELVELLERWQISIQKWKLTGRSLLNRDAEGNLKFAHRTIMEYLFVAQAVLKNELCYGVILTDQMKQFLFDILSGGNPIVRNELYILSRENFCVGTSPEKVKDKSGAEISIDKREFRLSKEFINILKSEDIHKISEKLNELLDRSIIDYTNARIRKFEYRENEEPEKVAKNITNFLAESKVNLRYSEYLSLENYLNSRLDTVDTKTKIRALSILSDELEYLAGGESITGIINRLKIKAIKDESKKILDPFLQNERKFYIQCLDLVFEYGFSILYRLQILNSTSRMRIIPLLNFPNYFVAQIL